MTALLGKTIVCTGEPESDASLADLLTNQSAQVLHYPCIAIAPFKDLATLDAELKKAASGSYTWVVFTSANAVEQVFARLQATGTEFPKARIAAIGPTTARSLRVDSVGGEGVSAIFLPSTYTAATLAAELPITPGDSVLIPQADIALPTLAEGLRVRGASARTVTAYTTTTGSDGIDLPSLLIQGKISAVLFASPSAVAGCCERFKQEGRSFGVLSNIPVICIGPVTAAAARDLGLTYIVTAAEHTRSGMANALLAEFAAHREETHA